MNIKKYRKFLLPAVALGLIINKPGFAGNERNLICIQNNGSFEKNVKSIDKGPTFTLVWDDQLEKNFKWVASNQDRHNITDKDGTPWHYHDHRTGGGMTLINLDNKNQIYCKKKL